MRIFKRKKRIGIDINEILRAKWLQVDRYYCQEFSEDGAPKQPYVYDFFKEYKWEDTTEIIKELKEPEECPETINPLDYKVDEKTGEAPADFLLFKKIEKETISAKEKYNRFMYQDYLLEIHGLAPKMYKDLDVDVNKFYFKYFNTIDFTVSSVENKLSIPPTLFFLSKINCRFNEYRFVEKNKDLWDGIDILITTDPEILKAKIPWGKKLIKVIRPYNQDIKSGCLEILQIADLIENKEFEKLIGYKKQ